MSRLARECQPVPFDLVLTGSRYMFSCESGYSHRGCWQLRGVPLAVSAAVGSVTVVYESRRNGGCVSLFIAHEFCCSLRGCVDFVSGSYDRTCVEESSSAFTPILRAIGISLL